MDPALVALAIREIPTVIDGIKALFARHHPDQPQPTSEEVMAALESAFQSSLARGDAWLAAHPK